MYQEFYHFRQLPFNSTADPEFLFLSRKHEEVLHHLLYGVEQRKGFLQVIGEVGTGKTTLCKELLKRLPVSTKTAFIYHSNLSELQLLMAIAQDLGARSGKQNRLALINTMNEFLLEQSVLRSNVVLLIDEAQCLSDASLEQLRLLSNLETQKEKLLQIVFVGQPELDRKLNSVHLRQLRQRIAVRSYLLPLNREETAGYIHHRIKIAGGESCVNFSEEATHRIFQYSQGTPRMINLVCDRVLLAGFVKQTHHITEELISRAIEELEGVVV